MTTIEYIFTPDDRMGEGLDLASTQFYGSYEDLKALDVFVLLASGEYTSWAVALAGDELSLWQDYVDYGDLAKRKAPPTIEEAVELAEAWLREQLEGDAEIECHLWPDDLELEPEFEDEAARRVYRRLMRAANAFAMEDHPRLPQALASVSRIGWGYHTRCDTLEALMEMALEEDNWDDSGEAGAICELIAELVQREDTGADLDANDYVRLIEPMMELEAYQQAEPLARRAIAYWDESDEDHATGDWGYDSLDEPRRRWREALVGILEAMGVHAQEVATLREQIARL